MTPGAEGWDLLQTWPTVSRLWLALESLSGNRLPAVVADAVSARLDLGDGPFDLLQPAHVDLELGLELEHVGVDGVRRMVRADAIFGRASLANRLRGASDRHLESLLHGLESSERSLGLDLCL